MSYSRICLVFLASLAFGLVGDSAKDPSAQAFGPKNFMLTAETESRAGRSRALDKTPVAPALLSTYCVSCHGADKPKGNLNLSAVVGDDVTRQPQIWEKVIRRLRTRTMPPPGKDRPEEESYQTV